MPIPLQGVRTHDLYDQSERCSSALVEYDSSTNALSSNIRLRWEYQPGCELFIVYNERATPSRPARLPRSRTARLS